MTRSVSTCDINHEFLRVGALFLKIRLSALLIKKNNKAKPALRLVLLLNFSPPSFFKIHRFTYYLIFISFLNIIIYFLDFNDFLNYNIFNLKIIKIKINCS